MRAGAFQAVSQVRGHPALPFTGVFPECQCLAFGTSDLRHWTNAKDNPVTTHPPAGLEVEGFRNRGVC